MIRPGLALFPAAALLALAHPLAAGVGPVAQAYVSVASCRAVDTRGPAGSNGGPALAANEVRIFTISGAPSPTAARARAMSSIYCRHPE